MTSSPSAVLEAGSRVIRLRRFASVPECTMPQNDEPCSRTACRYHLSNRQPGEHRMRSVTGVTDLMG